MRRASLPFGRPSFLATLCHARGQAQPAVYWTMSPAGNTPLRFNRDRTERELDARLEDLLAKLRRNRPSEDPWLVRRAYEIAAERHRTQIRKSGEPYLIHL